MRSAAIQIFIVLSNIFAALSPGDIAAPIRWILRRQSNVQVWLADVTRIDTVRRVVHVADAPHEVTYDALIVAAGVTHSYFGHDDWQAHAPGLKTLEDALAIRSRVLTAFELAERESDPAIQRRLLTFVVVGGGPTGVELAGALAEISRHVIEAGTILWAAGVAASSLGASLGVPLDRAGRVIVNDDLTIPGHPEVSVIGDLTLFRTADGGTLPGVAQVAMQQGDHAARGSLAALAREPRTPFRYRFYGNMATIGRNSAIGDFGWMRLKGYPAWLAWLFIHIVQLIGFRNRFSVLLQWAISYMTYQRAVRLITGAARDDA